MTGLKSTDDTAKYLKLYRIKKYNEDLNKIAEGVKAQRNRFEHEADENLYCLSTG